MKKDKIIVVGSYIVALVMDTERIPIKGETLKGKNYRQTHGGKGSNQAVQAARLGGNVAFVGKIGDDPFGEDFINLCKQENIDHQFISRHNVLPTATGFIICAEGHNVITIDIGAITEFTENDIDPASALFSSESLVLLQLEIPLDTALYTARKAKERGAVVVLNPAPAVDLSKEDLSFVDFLTPNETEVRICAGLGPDDEGQEADIASKLLMCGCKNIIVTLGENGCLLVNRSHRVHMPGFNIESGIDSTGAGDAFNAGLAVALAEGLPVKSAMQLANAAGALACTKADTIPSFHYRSEVDSFIEKQSGIQ